MMHEQDDHPGHDPCILPSGRAKLQTESKHHQVMLKGIPTGPSLQAWRKAQKGSVLSVHIRFQTSGRLHMKVLRIGLDVFDV